MAESSPENADDQVAYTNSTVAVRLAGPDRAGIKIKEERMVDLRGAVELFIQLREVIPQLMCSPRRSG